MSEVIKTLSLEGHDSELFSFLEPGFKEQLRGHEAASMPLWTFGRVHEGALSSVPMWNGIGGGFVWTKEPAITQNGNGWYSHRGYVSDGPLIRADSLTLVRMYFSNGHVCLLDDKLWVTPADPLLERLRYIRGYGEASSESPEWAVLECEYFDWCIAALDKVLAKHNLDHID